MKRSHAALFLERKGNLKIRKARFYFNLSENYHFVPQGQIQSRY